MVKGSISQLVEDQPKKREVGRSIPSARFALCGMHLISALTVLELLFAVHELAVPVHVKGKKREASVKPSAISSGGIPNSSSELCLEILWSNFAAA